MVQGASFPVSVNMGKTGDAFFTGGEQLLAGEFRRGVQIKRHGVAGRRQALRDESMQMRLIAGGNLQCSSVDLKKIGAGEIAAKSRLDRIAPNEKCAAVGVDVRRPPWRHCLVARAHSLFFSVFSVAPNCG